MASQASLTPKPIVAFRLNAGDILAKLDRIQAAAGNSMQEPLRSSLVNAGIIYFEDMRARFQRASAGDGTWKPLHPKTIARKGHDRIEVETGRLFASFFPGNNGNMIRVTPEGVKCSITGPIYAKYQHYGSTRYSPKLGTVITVPPRPLVAPPSTQAKRRIFEVINDAARRTAEQIWQNRGGGGPSGGGSAGTNRSAA